MSEEQPVERRRRRSTDVWRMKPIVLAFFIITLLFFGTTLGFVWVVIDAQNQADRVKNLTIANRNLLIEIQKSRTESCRKTYEGVREVFKPLFPTPPLTPSQLDTLATFNGTIDDLKKGCVEQTEPD